MIRNINWLLIIILCFVASLDKWWISRKDISHVTYKLVIELHLEARETSQQNTRNSESMGQIVLGTGWQLKYIPTFTRVWRIKLLVIIMKIITLWESELDVTFQEKSMLDVFRKIATALKNQLYQFSRNQSQRIH